MQLAVAPRERLGFRVLFHCEALFEDRMHDIFFRCSTRGGAPFLDEIFDELWDIMAKTYVAFAQPDMSPSSHETLALIASRFTPDHLEEARVFVHEHAGYHFLDLFQRDVMLYLYEIGLTFFIRERPNTERSDAILINPAVISVW